MGILSALFGSKADQFDQEALLAAGAVIIDVRSIGEFAGGHASKAKNIPLDQLASRVKELEALKKPILLCCASGMRSGQATAMLKEAGLEAYNAGPWTNLR